MKMTGHAKRRLFSLFLALVMILSEFGFGGMTARADSVTTIGDSAFYLCYYLSKVRLGKNVETIERNAFMETGLTQLVVPE